MNKAEIAVKLREILGDIEKDAKQEIDLELHTYSGIVNLFYHETIDQHLETIRDLILKIEEEEVGKRFLDSDIMIIGESLDVNNLEKWGIKKARHQVRVHCPFCDKKFYVGWDEPKRKIAEENAERAFESAKKWSSI